MNDRSGGKRNAGVNALLLAQAALAAFLGLVATIHRDDAKRFDPYLRPPYTANSKTLFRVRLDKAGVVADSAIALMAVVSGLLTLSAWKYPKLATAIQRVIGWLSIAAACLFIVAGALSPRIGSPNNDVFPGVGFWAGALITGVLGACALNAARSQAVVVER